MRARTGVAVSIVTVRARAIVTVAVISVGVMSIVPVSGMVAIIPPRPVIIVSIIIGAIYRRSIVVGRRVIRIISIMGSNRNNRTSRQ